MDQFCSEGWNFALKDGNQLVRVSEYGSGSRCLQTVFVHSRQNGLSHIRFFSAKKGRKSKQNGRFRVFVKPISLGFLCGLVRVSCETHLRPSFQINKNGAKRRVTIRLWSGFPKH
jgi:hypothetical protein